MIKPEPSKALLAWLGAQKDDDLFIASLTVAEIQRGILEKPRGVNAMRLIAGSAGQTVRWLSLPVASCRLTNGPLCIGRA